MTTRRAFLVTGLGVLNAIRPAAAHHSTSGLTERENPRPLAARQRRSMPLPGRVRPCRRTDPIVLAVSLGLVLSVTVVAVMIPARRMTLVHPGDALRAE